jgi:hypothetical protein
VDRGRLVVTTTRAVFTGDKASREFPYAKLLGVEGSTDGTAVLLHLSNRQKPSGLVTTGPADHLQDLLALGLAVAQHGAGDVAAECVAEAAAHRAQEPGSDR